MIAWVYWYHLDTVSLKKCEQNCKNDCSEICGRIQTNIPHRSSSVFVYPEGLDIIDCGCPG